MTSDPQEKCERILTHAKMDKFSSKFESRGIEIE